MVKQLLTKKIVSTTCVVKIIFVKRSITHILKIQKNFMDKYMVWSSEREIQTDLPSNAGEAVHHLAKLRILDFCYIFLLENLLTETILKY